MQSGCSRLFIVFGDTLFTTSQKPLFTKAFNSVAKNEAGLACGVGASPINSPAT
jgi:hypothetical protein